MSFQFLAEVVHRVLEPYLMLFEKAIERIPVKAENSSQLGLGNPMRAKGFDRHILDRGSCRVLPLADELAGKIVGQLDGELHTGRVAPGMSEITSVHR